MPFLGDLSLPLLQQWPHLMRLPSLSYTFTFSKDPVSYISCLFGPLFLSVLKVPQDITYSKRNSSAFPHNLDLYLYALLPPPTTQSHKLEIWIIFVYFFPLTSLTLNVIFLLLYLHYYCLSYYSHHLPIKTKKMMIILLEIVITSFYWVPTHTRYWYIPGSLYMVTHV